MKVIVIRDRKRKVYDANVLVLMTPDDESIIHIEGNADNPDSMTRRMCMAYACLDSIFYPEELDEQRTDDPDAN